MLVHSFKFLDEKNRRHNSNKKHFTTFRFLQRAFHISASIYDLWLSLHAKPDLLEYFDLAPQIGRYPVDKMYR